MIAGVRSQLSVDTGVPVLDGSVLAVHSIVIFAGQVMDGATVSSIVMVCIHVDELLQSSVACQVRVITYSCGQPVGILFTSEYVIESEASQLSDAVAVPVLAGKVLAVHCMVRLAGQVITGTISSMMVITCTQVDELVQSSVACQVRLIVYA